MAETPKRRREDGMDLHLAYDRLADVMGEGSRASQALTPARFINKVVAEIQTLRAKVRELEKKKGNHD